MKGNLIEKSLKRYLKRKVKITLGLITAFLITGAVSFSAVEIGYDGDNITVDGIKITGDTWVNNKEIKDEIILTKEFLTSGIELNIENNEKILFDSNSGTGNGNGIAINLSDIADGKIGNIINNGMIVIQLEKVKLDDTFSKGNGIAISKFEFTEEEKALTFNNIVNNGIVSEQIQITEQDISECRNTGNGIGIYSCYDNITFNDIVNKGIIDGNLNLEKENLQDYFYLYIENIKNGIGIYDNRGKISLNNLINKGIISGITKVNKKTMIAGEVSNIGNGIGIYTHFGEIFFNNIINQGFINKNIEQENLINFSAHFNIGNGVGIYNAGGEMNLNDLSNKGVINGNKGHNSYVSNTGNGIGIYGSERSSTERSSIGLNEISNIGMGTGYSEGNTLSESNVGNGLSFYDKDMKMTISGNISNIGTLTGYVKGNIDNTSNGGNGLGIYNTEGTITLNNGITNKGTLIGYIDGTVDDTSSGGNGLSIYNLDGTITLNGITNTGLIIGSEHGIYLKDITMNNGKYHNYGVVGGKTAVKIENSNIQDNNSGLYLTFDENNNDIVKEVKVGTVSSDIDYTIVNTLKSNTSSPDDINIATLRLSDLPKNSNLILNGVYNTFTIDDNSTVELSDSIINAYKNAIAGEGGNNTFTLKGNSILNGDVAMGAGNDTVSFDSKVQINGNLDGGTNTDADTKDTLNLGINSASDRGTLDKTFDNSLKIYDSVISGFENINIKDNVTVFETAKIKDAETLTIEKGNQLNLRIDGTKKDEQTGNIIGHALYGNNGLIITGTTDDSTDDTITENENADKYNKAGILNLVTSGLGKGAVIDFAGVTFDTDTSDEEDKGVWVKTDNLLDNVVINNDETITIDGEKDIFKIIAKVTPPDPVDPTDPSDTSGKLYEKLNDIYKGAYSSGDENFIEIKNIITNTGIKGDGDYTEVTEEQQLKTLLAYLKEIYTNSLYSFTSDASRKSMGMFRDAVRENNFKALDDEWIIYGGFTHIDGNREQTYYGRNYHKFDTGSYDNNADVKMTGAYAQAEYGLDNTLSAGILFGGNKSDIEVSNSKADGNSMYLGGYIKKDIKDFRITAGAGMQYSEYDAERNMSNRKYDDKYSDNAFDIYVNGKYFYEISDNLYFEPYGQLAYTYVDQEGINENDGALSLNIKDKDFTFIEGTIGADLRKEIIKDDIKHNFKGGISYTRLLDGYKEDNLTADFGGNSFDILVPHKTPDELKIGVRYELERTDGLMFSVNADYLISMDSKDNGHKNENENEWRIGAGFGYRFNSQFFGE